MTRDMCINQVCSTWVLLFISTIHHSTTRGLLSTMPVKVVIMTLREYYLREEQIPTHVTGWAVCRSCMSCKCISMSVSEWRSYLLEHVPHDYCTLETWECPSHYMCTFYSVHTGYVYASGLLEMLIDVHWYSAIHPQYQQTVLHYASKGGHHDTVRVLLDKGADPNTREWVSGV